MKTSRLWAVPLCLAWQACAGDGNEPGQRQSSHGSVRQGRNGDVVLAATSAADGGEAADGLNKGDPAPVAPSEGKDPASILSPVQTPTQSPTQTPLQGVPPAETPAALTVDSLTTSGGACPAGSVATNVAPDAKAFTLLFDAFALEYDPLNGLTALQTACRVDLRLNAPVGWQFTVLTVDWRGFADIPASMDARLDTDMSFPLGPTPANSLNFTSRLDGAYSDDYQVRAEAALKTANWSDCGAVKTLRLDLLVQLETAGKTTDTADTALLTVDSLDGELHHQAGLAWRRCN